MKALGIVGLTIAGSVIGYAGGVYAGMRDMDNIGIMGPVLGVMIGGFAGVVIGAVVFT